MHRAVIEAETNFSNVGADGEALKKLRIGAGEAIDRLVSITGREQAHAAVEAEQQDQLMGGEAPPVMGIEAVVENCQICGFHAGAFTGGRNVPEAAMVQRE